MPGSDDLFATSSAARARLDYLGGEIPVLLVDDLFEDPQGIRETALSLPFEPAGAHYPGRKAKLPPGHQSLDTFIRKVAGVVTAKYLPQLPPFPDGRRRTRIQRIQSDFAITDARPGELTKEQTRPHIDNVPLFGLVYLNEEDRGGTLFFRPRSSHSALPPRFGYQTDSDEFAELVGKIEGRFNRLAIYPGFILHTGEIKGDWIDRKERLSSPRLTQRLMFFL